MASGISKRGFSDWAHTDIHVFVRIRRFRMRLCASSIYLSHAKCRQIVIAIAKCLTLP